MTTLSNKIISTCFTRQQALAMLTDLRSQDESSNKKINYEDYSKAEKEIEECPTVVMYLAIDPLKSEINKIARKVREGRKDKVLLDIRQEANVLGGAKIAFNGKLKDYTISKKLGVIPNLFRDLRDAETSSA